MRILTAALLILLVPAWVQAGAWPRKVGETFLSFSTTLTSARDPLGHDLQSDSSIYVERGIRENLTFGLDGQIDLVGEYSLLAFLRRPIMQRAERNRFAVLGGAGVIIAGDQTIPLVRIGAAWGRGLQTRFGSGWASVDTSAEYRGDQSDVSIKADLTLGLKPTDRLKLILQLQTGRYVGSDPYIRLAPSVVRQFGPGRHIELGLQVGVAGDDRVGLKMGSWLEF